MPCALVVAADADEQLFEVFDVHPYLSAIGHAVSR